MEHSLDWSGSYCTRCSALWEDIQDNKVSDKCEAQVHQCRHRGYCGFHGYFEGGRCVGCDAQRDALARARMDVAKLANLPPYMVSKKALSANDLHHPELDQLRAENETYQTHVTQLTNQVEERDRMLAEMAAQLRDAMARMQWLEDAQVRLIRSAALPGVGGKVDLGPEAMPARALGHCWAAGKFPR